VGQGRGGQALASVGSVTYAHLHTQTIPHTQKYLEIDLYVPEYIEKDASIQREPWYEQYRRAYRRSSSSSAARNPTRWSSHVAAEHSRGRRPTSANPRAKNLIRFVLQY
jgi:hypothetical protein